MKLTALVIAAALQHNLPPRLLHGIVMQESHYDCGAPNGGIGQVLPTTARGLGVLGDLTDCRVGLEAAARYLHLALERAHGDWQIAATLYNRGLGAAPRPTGYSRSVMRYANGES